MMMMMMLIMMDRGGFHRVVIRQEVAVLADTGRSIHPGSVTIFRVT